MAVTPLTAPWTTFVHIASLAAWARLTSRFSSSFSLCSFSTSEPALLRSVAATLVPAAVSPIVIVVITVDDGSAAKEGGQSCAASEETSIWASLMGTTSSS